MDMESELEAHGIDLKPEVFIQLVLQAIASQRRSLRQTPTRPLSELERAAYLAGGFDLQERYQGAASPLARSLAEFAAVIVEARSVTEVAELTGVSPSCIRHRIARSGLYGFRLGGRWKLPRFQFDGRRVLPNLQAVVRELHEDLHPLSVCRFFLTPQADLFDESQGKPLCPRDWMLRNLPAQPVSALARDMSAS